MGEIHPATPPYTVQRVQKRGWPIDPIENRPSPPVGDGGRWIIRLYLADGGYTHVLSRGKSFAVRYFESRALARLYVDLYRKYYRGLEIDMDIIDASFMQDPPR